MGHKHRLGALLLCLFAAAAAHAQLPSAPQPQITPPVTAQTAVAQAEIHTGSINGTVTDVNGDPVLHSNITLDGPVTHSTISADANGFFVFNELPLGSYHLSITAQGFADYTAPDIALKSGQALDLTDITLQISGTASTVNVSYTQQEIATQEVHVEEKQRVLGIIPNFYAVYTWNAAPLSPKLKFSLAWKTFFDPMTAIAVASVAGMEQGLDTFPAWGQDWAGYGQRFGAATADNFSANMLLGAVFPILLHQDPRFYYKANGSARSKILYAISTVVICKGDNGKWQPNYSSVLGTFSAGALSNAYYPPAQRGIRLTVDTALINLASGAIGGLFQEFVLKRLTPTAKGQ